MLLKTRSLLTWLLCFSLSCHLYANPFPVYFADVIREEGKEILHFEWRPDYKSYDRALITDHNGAMVAELGYPLNRKQVKLYMNYGPKSTVRWRDILTRDQTEALMTSGNND